MVKLIFETHSTSVDNERAVASGHYNAALSPRGEEQARELGARYRGQVLAAVFCSDLQRSYRTAAIAFADRETPVFRDPRLRECDYGDLTRRPQAEIEAIRADCVNRPFPNGESYSEAALRVKDFLSDIRSSYSGTTVLLIGHRATQYALEHWLKRVELSEAVTAPWAWQPGWEYELVR
jgi:broad specificity phosphatase PhoE